MKQDWYFTRKRMKYRVIYLFGWRYYSRNFSDNYKNEDTPASFENFHRVIMIYIDHRDAVYRYYFVANP